MKKLLFALMGMALCVSAQAKSVSITIDGQKHHLQIDATHRLLDAHASEKMLADPYVAATLQTLGELSADRRTLTLPAGTTVYVAPGVYWVDETYRQGFPFDESGFVLPPPNVGLSILGDNITFVGLTDNAKDAHIAGNRGEGGARGLGAGGSWYTLAVSSGFSARNITIANYAQEDLVYERDPSQNIAKRINSTNHAEVLRGAQDARIDRIHFDNVRFIGYLNMMAGFAPARSYFKDCVLQCTDDALFGGRINVYENCTFLLYGGHPSFSGASAGGINVLLNCRMIGMPEGRPASSTLRFVKTSRGNGADATSVFAILDTHFSGRTAAVEWENAVKPDSRHSVYNNTIGPDRKPLVISPDFPQTSVELSGENLKAFKIADNYNVYNLLRGGDGWNPSGQKTFTDPLPYRFLVGTTNSLLYSDKTGAENTTILSPAPEPAGAVDVGAIRWSFDNAMFDGSVDPKSGALTLHAKPNRSGDILVATATATLPNGFSAGATLNIYPVAEPPLVIKNPTIAISAGGGVATIDYRIDYPKNKDASTIEWYRETSSTSRDGVHVGTSHNDAAGLYSDAPQKEYELNKYDVGYYLRAVITPKHKFGPTAAPVELRTSCAIAAGDVVQSALTTDFRTTPIAFENHLTTTGRWFFDRVSPEDSIAPWGWGIGSNGAEGIWGLMNNRSRDSRLVFAQTGGHGDMRLELDYSPGKNGGQGFGGSGCFLDVYIKYDPATRTGYGLRIERVPATTAGTEWSLYRFEGESQTPLTEGVLTSAFMPDGKIVLRVEGNTLYMEGSTKSERGSRQMEHDLPNRIELSWTDASGELGRNTFGGFGVRTRNSGGASYLRGSVGTNNCVVIQRIAVR